MNRLKWLVVFVGFCSALNAQIKDEDYYVDISKALGYYYGVELSNNLIQEKFRDLAQKSMMAQLKFSLDQVQTDRFVSIIDKENIDSINVALKNGMSVLFETSYLGMEVEVYGIRV